jgi:hypothetical protein
VLLEFFLAHNPAYDDYVLWDDGIERRLTDADETAAAFRLRGRHGQQFALIWKRERDPDQRRPLLDALTLGYRGERTRGATSLMAELALQHQDWSGSVAQADTSDVDESGFAWAGQLRLRRQLDARDRLDLGVYAYSGRDSNHFAFRTPWGRWPKWSELLLYRLIGEDGVGAWANLAAPWIEIQRRTESLLLAAGAQMIFSPEPRWAYRDLLTRARLEWTLPAGLSAQLLAEFFEGTGEGQSIDYSPAWDSASTRPIEKGGGYFLRWQLNYQLE